MDNVGDWLYIVFLIIAAVSGYSVRKTKEERVARYIGATDREIVPNDQPTEGKGFWRYGGYAKGNAKT